MMTVLQFWGMIATMVVISTGAFGWVIWATKKISKHETKFADNDKMWTDLRTERKAEKLVMEVDRKADALSVITVQKELMQVIHEGYTAIFTKLDEIKADTGKMQIDYGRVDERLKVLEKEKQWLK